MSDVINFLTGYKKGVSSKGPVTGSYEGYYYMRSRTLRKRNAVCK